jgi:multidrug efflux pump subunit AcrB
MVKDSTWMYDIGKVAEEWRKLVAEAVSASSKADVDRNSVETDIKKRQADLALTVIEEKAKKAGIALTWKQIYQIDAQVKAAFMSADAQYWQAESSAKNANTSADAQSWDRHINDISESTGLSFEVVKGIFQALALKGLMGNRTVVEGFKKKY